MAAVLRAVAAVAALLVGFAAVPAPAAAVTEDDLREKRLELQEALGELEAATWDHRIAGDNLGLLQFELEELAGETEGLRRARAADLDSAAGRSLALYNGLRDGSWLDRNIATRYLGAALDSDNRSLGESAAVIDEMDAGLGFLTGEIETFAASEADASGRVAEWEQRVAELEIAYASLAAEYEAELQYLATSTTTTTVPPTTTTLPPTTTSTTVPGTTTTTSTSTTTIVPPSTTTTISPTTTTVPPPTTTTTTPPISEDGLVCPVQGPHHFRDTWGAPRSGGRTHQGVDMMADRGTPLVAIETGTVGRLGDGGLGGITVWFIGDGGAHYYYAHLDSWAPGLAQGQRIEAGGALGTVGSTGNAPEEWPHLHFEIHPDGGAAVNPYPTVSAICP